MLWNRPEETFTEMQLFKSHEIASLREHCDYMVVCCQSLCLWTPRRYLLLDFRSLRLPQPQEIFGLGTLGSIKEQVM